MADTQSATFVVRGATQPLTISKSTVVIVGTGDPAETEKWRPLADIGLGVAPRATTVDPKSIVGYPIRFGDAPDAVAVLTHEIVVRAKSKEAILAIVRQPEFRDFQEAPFKQGLYLAKYGSPLSALAAANALVTHSQVAYAHPNFIIPKTFRGPAQNKSKLTDDPLFSVQWHLENSGGNGGTADADVDATEAWAVTEGVPETIVGVIDTGFQITHPDLDGIFLSNVDELPGNGIDDDHNGYIDDTLGWNFSKRTNDVATADIIDHGTAVAGIVAARRNRIGVVGMCPGCKILPVVVAFDPIRDAEAINYAYRNGAAVISNSWGYAVGTPETDVVIEAIADARTEGRGGKGSIIVFAMNNADRDDCVGRNPDISADANVVAVSSASDRDVKVSASAWGNCMEILGPSKEVQRQGIATTDMLGARGYNNGRFVDLPDLDYTNVFGGTSAATPVVSGIFGLILSIAPDLTRDEALQIVVSTADKINPTEARYAAATGFSQKYGFGRINAAKAVRAAKSLPIARANP